MGDSEPDRPLLSIVVPCFNEEAPFGYLREAMERLFAQLEPEYRVELLLIDDGSRDATWSLISRFSIDNPRVRGVSLSRNFGHQAALACGYELAQGDAVVSIDADLQDPPEVIVDLVAKWREGADVVYAVRSSREGEPVLRLAAISLFYRLIRTMGASNVRADAGDFRLMSRRSVDALNQLREQHRFIRGMVGWIGFKTAEVTYDRKKRVAGRTKYPFRKLLALAVDGAVSFSAFPLRLTYIFAGLMGTIILSYLVYAGIRHFVYGVELAPGWTSLLLTAMGFGSLTLFCLGVMGEYVGRTYEQTKGRPLYFVQELTAKNARPEAQDEK